MTDLQPEKEEEEEGGGRRLSPWASVDGFSLFRLHRKGAKSIGKKLFLLFFASLFSVLLFSELKHGKKSVLTLTWPFPSCRLSTQ